MKKKLLVGLGLILCLSMVACGTVEEEPSGSRRHHDTVEDRDDSDDDDDSKESKKKKDKEEKEDKEKEDKEKEDKEKEDKEKEDKEKEDKEKEDKEKEDKEKEDKEKEDKDKEDKEKEDKDEKDEVDADQKQTNFSKSGELSDDLYAYQISINGHVYSLPCTFAELEDNGYFYDGDSSETLAANHKASTNVFKYDKHETLYASIVNFDVVEKPFSECMIGKIKIDSFQAKQNRVEIAKNIVLGESTMDDVIAAFGEPDSRHESDSYPSVTYSPDYDHSIRISFNAADGNVVQSVEMENLTLPEDFSASEVDASVVPELVKKYETPKKIGDDIWAYNMKFDGEIINLPAPVSVFLDNGWKFVNDEATTLVGSNSYTWIEIKKGDKKLRTIAQNITTNAVYPENCYIIELKASDIDCDVDFEMALGIKKGTSEADVKEALKGIEYEYDNSSSFADYYCIKDENRMTNGYTIRVVNGKVSGVYMEHYLKADELEEFYKNR